MSTLEQTYELRLRVNGELKTVHKTASSPYQAMVKAKKLGTAIHVRKVDFTKIFGNIEDLNLEQGEKVEVSPYTTAIAMDEMIWKKKDNRIKRLNNRQKDKERA